MEPTKAEMDVAGFVAPSGNRGKFMSEKESMATACRRQARETREAAVKLFDPGAKRDALDVASQWDRIASAWSALNEEPEPRIGNVLFLCTGNSARSIMAEAILDHWANGRFKGYSGGSTPEGEVHPLATSLLKQFEMRSGDLRSKSWTEFARADAPTMDYIFTLCDQAAGEACPEWPGQPITAHWGVPDPAAVTGSATERALAFRAAFHVLEARIRYFLTFEFKALDRAELQRMALGAGKLQG